MPRTLKVAAGVALVAAGSVLAQEPVPRPVFRTGTSVVQIDITVLDRDRKTVRGLTAADFTILEDGQPQPIVSFEPVELPSQGSVGVEGIATAAPDVTSNQLNAQRLVVIVFDDANTGVTKGFGMTYRDPWILRTGKQIARDVVNRLGPRDLAAVVFTYMGRAQNFTTDRSRLLSAVDAFIPQNSPPGSFGSGGPPLACSFRGVEGNCVLDTLRHVAEALPSSPPRRKVVVFISQGHRLPLVSTDDEGGLTLPSSQQLQQIGEVQRTLRALQHANVTVFAYSPGGLQVVPGEGSMDALRGLAEHTGGRATVETNAPWTTVPAMFEETESYYLVGFEATRTDGRFHRVNVRVNRNLPRVRPRRGSARHGRSSTVRTL